MAITRLTGWQQEARKKVRCKKKWLGSCVVEKLSKAQIQTYQPLGSEFKDAGRDMAGENKPFGSEIERGGEI